MNEYPSGVLPQLVYNIRTYTCDRLVLVLASANVEQNAEFIIVPKASRPPKTDGTIAVVAFPTEEHQ